MATNTDQERVLKLQNLSEEHLYYEIWMLYEVTFKLAIEIQDNVVKNALIESFVIHAAIVLDFLFKERAWPDDVIADDFVKDKNAWRSITTGHIERLSFVIQRRNKEIAHLSYKRLEVIPEEKDWYYVAITREISDLVDLFIDSANKDLLHNKVVSLKGVYRRNSLWRLVQDFDSASMRYSAQ